MSRATPFRQDASPFDAGSSNSTVSGSGIDPSSPDLDQTSIARLRQFFELLERWDREYTDTGSGGAAGNASETS